MSSDGAGRDRQATWVLTMVIATTALTGLGLSIMVVTFPAMRAEFPDASAAQLSWINNLFTIVSAATLIPAGVLADRVGRKRMVLAGTALFAAGSLVGALAPSPAWIMVGRTLQALGAAAYGPAGTALLISAFPADRLPSAIGIWAVTSGVASAAGPSIGGIVVDHGGWPWAFWINVPICAFVLALGPVMLHETARDRSRRLPDPLGVALVMVSTAAITLGIVQSKTDPGWGWLGWKTWLCFAAGGAVLAWFIVRCRRSDNPLLDLKLFRSNRVRYGTIGLTATGIAFFAINWAFVQHTVNEWGWTIAHAGVATSPLALTSGISAVLSGRAASRYGQQPFMLAGTVGMLGSCAYLWFAIGAEPSLAAVLVGGCVLGISSGLVMPAFIATTLLGTPADQHSVGSAINFMAQRTSATIGIALAITFIAGSSSSGLRRSILAGAVGTAVALVLVLVLERPERAESALRQLPFSPEDRNRGHTSVADTETTSFSADDLHARYEQERLKRLSEGVRSYRSLRDLDKDFDADPFVEPGFTREPVVEDTDVVVVGTGWAGMSAAAHLTKQGITDYRMIDKAGDFGGTWYWNRYPGCMCDVESYTYLPLLEEVGYMPTKKYAHAQEIFEYAQMLGRHFDMYPHALFQTEVTGMVWNADTKRWLVTTSRDDQISARFVTICGGVLHKAKLPGIAGIETFAGHSFHTSRWDYAYTGGAPEEPMDKLHDKVVAVIGTGATGIQVVPKLAAAAKELLVFQRTPSSVSPRNQRPTDPEWFKKISAQPGWHEERMENFIDMTTGANPPVDLIQDGWTEMFAVDVKKDPVDDEEAAALKQLDFELMEKVRQRVSDTVEDPATAEALKPWYGVSCKRPCYHDDYLPTFNRDNVTLVDTDGKGVEAITERGIVVDGTEYPVDCIVYATGFDAPTTFYTHRLGFDPVGEDGVSLSESWSQGPWTLHGIFTHGFPNLCMNGHVQGGQHINIAYAATKNAEHTAWVIRQALDEGVTVQPDPDAEDAWLEVIQETLGAYGAYFAACTPGYLNNELQMPEEHDARSGAYMHSAVKFKNILAAWRAEGSLAGLVRTPIDR